MTYLTLKTLHILSMVLLFGAGLGSAFYKWMADRQGKDSDSGNVAHIAATNRHVVLADWLFTAPTVIFQPISGVWLAALAGWPLTTPWIALSLGLYAVAGACWLPVVWLQIRMKNLSADAASRNMPLPPAYWRMARLWFWLGVPAFAAMLLVVALMVFKYAGA
ncbi:MAG: DUF2269 domain-containing protein [Zoogloeaceae bacterium]|jgi:uncharacterized membrane protein|nr:DUF2269 domain-containing protein [Zoogloeaceae bacterium]